MALMAPMPTSIQCISLRGSSMRVLGFHSASLLLRGVGKGKRQLRAPALSRCFAMADKTQQAISKEQAEEAKMWQRVNDHQKTAARLSHADEARTLLANKTVGYLSTISQKHEGYPFVSMVEFASDSNGQPILAVSSLSAHTKDLDHNPKCSLLVAKDPVDKSQPAITIVGEASFLSGENREETRDLYLAKYPSAFWVDFGDFRLAKIKPECVRFVTGLATGHAAVSDLDGDVYGAAKADPITQFSTPIASHMNKDHSEDTKAIVEHAVGVKVDYATMLDLDALGFNVKAGIQGISTTLRIPFPRPAQDRKDVKTLIVEMLNAAKPTS